MEIQIQVLGTKEVEELLKKKQKEVTSQVQTGINKATLYTQGEVKLSIAGHRAEPTSVDTGRFLNSVDIKTEKDTGIVFTNVPYSKHLEYGTSRLKARRHFNNSLDRNKNKIKEIFKDEIKKQS